MLNPKSYINCSKHKSKSACILFHSSTRTSPACQKVHLCYKVDQLTMLRKPLLSQRYMQSNLWHQCCDTAAAVLDAKRLQLSSCFAFTLLAFTHCSVSFSLVVWFCLNSKLLGFGKYDFGYKMPVRNFNHPHWKINGQTVWRNVVTRAPYVTLWAWALA